MAGSSADDPNWLGTGMTELEEYLASLTENVLLVTRVADHVTVADFQPCRATVVQAGLSASDGLQHHQRRLAEFDSRDQTITIWPIKTRTSAGFLRPRYPGLLQIGIEVEGLEEPEDGDRAGEVLENFLPQGFVRDWRWGLGLHKPYSPIISAVSQIHDQDERIPTSRSLRIARTEPTGIRKQTYILNQADYDQLRSKLFGIQTRHQRDSLAERTALSFNSLLADRFPETYRRKKMPYRADAVLRVVQTLDGVRISSKDRSVLLAEAGRRAPESAATSPEELTHLHTTLEVAALDAVIGKFKALLNKTTPEKEWQALLGRHPFILGLLFGHPVVLVGEQAAIGGTAYDGKGERRVDFLLKTEATHTAAIVELKRADTRLVRDTAYASVPAIHSDLQEGIMQILDQQVCFLTHLHAKRGATAEAIEGWHVSCVVIAGLRPEDPLKAKAFELYRAAQCCDGMRSSL
jgi:hypothetical protein